MPKTRKISENSFTRRGRPARLAEMKTATTKSPRLSRSTTSCWLIAFHIVGWSHSPILAQTERANRVQQIAGQPFGIETRVPWRTSHVRGRPEPPLPLKAKRVYQQIQFASPTVLTSAPGTERLFVAERSGSLYSLPAETNAKQADLFLDMQGLVKLYNSRLKKQDRVALAAVYGLTFHPRFDENRYCYLCYVVRYANRGRGTHPQGTRVVRLTATRTDPPRAIAESEVEIISWLEGGHNGGCLKFARDGKLFISTGDGAAAYPPDTLRSGQDVGTLLSAVLRIDVDNPSGGQQYSIPKDNPLVDLADARGEIWAYGMRNPWKMSVDRDTGELWVGDVGWQLWEMVYRVRPGDNYGWSLVEGSQPVHTEWERGPTPLVKPAMEIPHTEGASVTGGFVYRGKQFPQLVGHYIFGDYVTRRIWSVATAGDKLGPRSELAEATVRVAGFAERNNGELLLLDHDAGTIHEFAPNEPGKQHPFPRLLSESGLFESVADHRLAAGVIPFSIQTEMWADHAKAERFLAIPGERSIGLHTQPERIPGSYFKSWLDYPEDAVVAKTLSLDFVAGDSNTRRRIETQLLHFDGLEWRGYTYRWNREQTEAKLVAAAGETAEFEIADADYPGGKRRQQWRFAPRLECMRCHNEWAQSTLAFNIAQINRNHAYDNATDNQVRTLRHIGVLKNIDQPLGDDTEFRSIRAHLPAEYLPALVDPFDDSADLYLRGRSYLHANCAHCHREHGGGAARIHISHETPLERTEALSTRPTQGAFGVHQAEILAPGDPLRSIMYLRMAKSGPGHMPHIGAKLIDARGLDLIHDWIRNLPSRTEMNAMLDQLIELGDGPAAARDQLESAYRQQLLAKSFAKLDQRNTISKNDLMQAAELARQHQTKQLTARNAERDRLIDELALSPEGALLLARAHREHQLSKATGELVVQRAVASKNLVARDLFESFLPDEKRTKRLGESVDAATLLALPGDRQRGRKLFLEEEGITCRNCHQVKDKGESLGPELTQVGKKLTRAKILDNILHPSQTIEPEFRTWLIETSGGRVFSGLLVRRNAEEVVIRDGQRKEHRFPIADIETITPQRKSLMPELLLREMSAQQVADLLSWLASLK